MLVGNVKIVKATIATTNLLVQKLKITKSTLFKEITLVKRHQNLMGKIFSYLAIFGRSSDTQLNPFFQPISLPPAPNTPYYISND